MNLFLGDTCSENVSSIIAIIPARAGSKGLPNKNMLSLGDLPLVEHSIRLALSVSIIDFIVVTTNCPSILNLQFKYPSVYFIERPSHLAQDTSTLTEVIDLFFTFIDFDIGSYPSFLILQPTSPFRLPKNITSALSFVRKSYASSLISVSPMSQHPSECIEIGVDGWDMVVTSPHGSTRRQDYLNNYFFISGSFYFSTLQRFLDLSNDCFKSGSSLWNSQEPITVDIDQQVDFDLATNIFDYMTSLGYTYLSTGWIC